MAASVVALRAAAVACAIAGCARGAGIQIDVRASCLPPAVDAVDAVVFLSPSGRSADKALDPALVTGAGESLVVLPIDGTALVSVAVTARSAGVKVGEGSVDVAISGPTRVETTLTVTGYACLDAGAPDRAGGCGGDGDCGGPTPRCDLNTRACVECLPESDNCPMGTQCFASNGSYRCFGTCASDQDCPGTSCCAPICVDLATDPSHCGDCATDCTQHAQATCSGGKCQLASCDSGYGDCDKDPSNGCETDTTRDPAHCGGCGFQCPSNPVCAFGRCGLVAFVTSLAWDGASFGSQAGADAKCQALAQAANLNGRFLAWIGDHTSPTPDPASRFTRGTSPIVRPDNVVIAVDSLGLVSGNLLVPISVTEKGGAPPATTADVFCNYPGSTMVFTNALSDGTLGADAQDCAAWTDVGGQAWMGRADATDPQWSEACQNATCGFTGALYCFEQ